MPTITPADLVKQITKTSEQYAQMVENEMSLEDGRIKVKMEAVQRIMHSGDNPLTSKPHSFSSAEAIVNTDHMYSDYLAKVREAAVNRILARGNLDAALAAARLASESPVNV